MNELISGFRDALSAHLAGRLDFNSLERELITCIKQEPDFAATYSALIEARHRTGQLPEDSFLRLMQTVRGAMQAAGAFAPPRVPDARAPDDRTRLRSRPAADDGTLIRTPSSPAQTQWKAVTENSLAVHSATGPLTGPNLNGLTAPPTDSGGASVPDSSGWSVPGNWDDLSSPAPEPGSIIKDRFELLDVIGRGGMGVVFKARDRLKEEAGDRNPFVAIKILSEEFRRHPQAFRALQREARKAQKLAHPNIATVFDFERDGGIVFMHMELLEGESLERVIRRHDGSGLPVKDALRITEGLCAALAYAHQQGIVHSDFKPANAYLTHGGVVKVLDFGIARASKHRAVSWATKAATTLFDPRSLGALTPAYASCEMIEGLEPDPRDDIYGLAAVTYELLTGRHPFRKLSAVHARDAGLTPRPVRGISKRQWQALRRGLAFKREQRTPSVEQFLSEMSVRRTSPLAWTGVVAASMAILALVGVGTLWSLIVLTDQNSVWFERSLSVLSALPEGVRTTVLTGDTRNALVRGFRARIEHVFDPDKRRYDAPEAQRLVASLSALLPDSRAVDELARQLTDRKNKTLKQLRGRFSEYLSKGWLIEAQNPDNAAEVLAIVRQIDPQNALLTDERLMEAYLRESDRALKAGNVMLARALIDFGRQINPGESRLHDLNTAVDQESQEGPARIASLKQTLRSRLSASATLADFEAQLPLLASLSVIAKDDADVQSWQGQLQKLLDPKLKQLLAAGAIPDAEQLLEKFAGLLRPSYLDRARVALADARGDDNDGTTPGAQEQSVASVAQIKSRIDELLRHPSLTSAWNQQLREQFAKLATHLPATNPEVAGTKEQVTRIYLRAAATARERREVTRASWLLARAKEFAPNLPEIQPEEERLLAMRAQVEDENERQRLEAERNGLKQDLLAQTEADEVADALDTYNKLSVILDPADPFLNDARNEIAQSYMDLAEAAEKQDRRDEAITLVQRAAELVPQSKRVKFLQAKYSKPAAAPASSPSTETPAESPTRMAQGEETPAERRDRAMAGDTATNGNGVVNDSAPASAYPQSNR